MIIGLALHVRGSRSTQSKHHYSISTAGSLTAGLPYSHTYWLQLEHYCLLHWNKSHSGCGKINQHNCDQQDSLKLECKLGTLNWATHVNHTILGVCIVDSWKIYSHLAPGDTEAQNDF
jgi:hypothetical protein